MKNWTKKGGWRPTVTGTDGSPLAPAKRPAIVKGPETEHNLRHGHYYERKTAEGGWETS